MHSSMIIYLVAYLFSLFSVVVIGVLIGVIALQRVYGYLKAVKRLFIEALIAFIGIDLLMLIRRFLPLDAMATIIALKLMYSLLLFSAAAMGCAATIIYKKPKSSNWKDIYVEILSERKLFLTFLSFMVIILIFFILGWVTPLSVELVHCWPLNTSLYIPIFKFQHLIVIIVASIAFLSYPAAFFLLASYAVENATISRDLRTFASCVIGLSASVFIHPIFLAICLAEAVDILRITCLIGLVYVFRRINVLQSFKEVELGEYMARLSGRRRR